MMFKSECHNHSQVKSNSISSIYRQNWESLRILHLYVFGSSPSPNPAFFFIIETRVQMISLAIKIAPLSRSRKTEIRLVLIYD